MRAIIDTNVFIAGLNLLDDGLTALLPVLAQNWFFVLRKRCTAAAVRAFATCESGSRTCWKCLRRAFLTPARH